jgi:secretion/DNA translocation related CpaE-like protein
MRLSGVVLLSVRLHAGDMADSRSWLPQTEPGGAALITGSDYLKDEVARIAAAAAVPLTMLPRLQDAHLADGRILLVGADQAAAGVRPGPVILMGTAEDGERLWELAARMGAERVAVLPEAAGWLAEHLSRSASRSVRGSVVGMVGGAGGAGTSTLSCWLAHAAGELGHSALLVDGDPWGGGLELAVGAEQAPGVRWQDVGQVRGSLNPLQLVGSLPAVDGFALLSWAPTAEAPAEGLPAQSSAAARAVMEAGSRAHRLTVVDLGRAWLADPTLLSCCDSLVLVVPAQLRAIMAGRQLTAALSSLPLSVVVRGPFAADTDERVVADALGLPLAGRLPQLRGVRAAADSGRLLGQSRRRPVRRLTRALLAGLLGADEREAA